jgi:hypothetical protein
MAKKQIHMIWIESNTAPEFNESIINEILESVGAIFEKRKIKYTAKGRAIS